MKKRVVERIRDYRITLEERLDEDANRKDYWTVGKIEVGIEIT